jgi:hypothetical protein
MGHDHGLAGSLHDRVVHRDGWGFFVGLPDAEETVLRDGPNPGLGAGLEDARFEFSKLVQKSSAVNRNIPLFQK